MSGTVSTRWYFTDWMSDQNVRACSLAARGLWIDLLSIAGTNKGKEHGFVLIAGRVPTARELARLLGSTEEEITTLLAELTANKVCNVDRRKAIYCRRMVRAEKYRGNGRAGGNPNLLENKENKKAVSPPIPEPGPEPSLFPSGAPPPKKAKMGPLPQDWQPLIADIEYARDHGFDRSRIGELAQAFADHHRSRGNRMADWCAAWRTWVRNEVKFAARRGGVATTARPGNAFSQLHRDSRERGMEDDDGPDAEGPHGRGLVPAGRAR